MTKQITVDDTLKFCFPDDWEVCEYENKKFRKLLKDKLDSIGSSDLLALNQTDKILYIIEAKDYNKPSAQAHQDIVAEIKQHLIQGIAKQFAGTIAGLVCARTCCDSGLNKYYRALLDVETKIRFVAFVEFGKFKNEKMNTGLPLLTNLMQRLKSTMTPICCNKKVICDIDSLPASYGWSVTRVEQ